MAAESCLSLIWPEKNQDFSRVKSHHSTQNFILSPNLALLGTPDLATVMPNFGREKKTRAPEAIIKLPTPPFSQFLFSSFSPFVSYKNSNTNQIKKSFILFFRILQVEYEVSSSLWHQIVTTGTKKTLFPSGKRPKTERERFSKERNPPPEKN